ncbi:MAG: VanZ family protein [Enterococcus sp.]
MIASQKEILFLFILFIGPFLLIWFYFHRRTGTSTFDALTRGLLIAYVLLMIFLTQWPLPDKSELFTSRMYEIRPGTFLIRVTMRIREMIAHHEFISIHSLFVDDIVMQPILNILLFVPFGFLLKLASNWSNRLCLLLAFFTSLLIELTQFTGLWFVYPMPYRLFEVDDLLLNTLGGLIGILSAKYLMSYLPKNEL